MAGGETVEARHQPARREDRRDGDGEPRFIRGLGQQHGAVQRLEAGGQGGKDRRGIGKRHETTGGARKERPRQLCLGADHLLADGADRDAKLRRRGLQRAETVNAIDGTQAVEVDAIERFHADFL